MIVGAVIIILALLIVSATTFEHKEDMRRVKIRVRTDEEK